MSSPKYCECGRRIAVPTTRRLGKYTRAGRLPKHDLCRRCFGALLAQAAGG